eukprot:311129_1
MGGSLSAVILFHVLITSCINAENIKYPETFDCPMRQLAIEYAQNIQPFLTQQQLQDIADALNGSPEAQNCNISALNLPHVAKSEHREAQTWNDLNFSFIPSIYVDYTFGDDNNKGTASEPLKTLHFAIELARKLYGNNIYKRIILRAGKHYITKTVNITPKDNNLLITNYNKESVELSAAVPLNCNWTLYESGWKTLNNVDGIWGRPKGPEQNSSDNQVVYLGKFNSFDDCKNKVLSVYKQFGFGSFTWEDDTSGVYSNVCYGTIGTQYSGNFQSGSFTGVFVNIYECKITDDTIQTINSLRVNGKRAIRARYPNAIPETQGFSSELDAVSWFPSILPANPDQNINPSTPVRNDTTQNWFQTYSLGIGGSCENFYPKAGYWCANTTNGGGAFTYQIPSGLTYNSTLLPNTPYADGSQLIVQAWRPAYWASWMFEVGEYDANKQTMMFSRGGFQGARGDSYGAEFYVENVMEELDFPTEFFYNISTKVLYYTNNETNGDPSDLQFEVPQLKVLLNCTGTMEDPVKNFVIRGVTLKDTDITYMDDHGMPSGGDWGVQRTGSIYMEGTEDCRIESNLLTRLEGNAISINRYNRNLTIYRNEIVWNGDTAIVLWGDTENITFSYDKTTMGYDGTKGNVPMQINVIQNLIHEMGIWEKQSAAYFQAKSCSNNIIGNIIYNGPRAGINFNDGFGGNNTIERNLIFNVVRESSDHGPFNSWDRQVYLTTIRTGEPSVIKANDHIHHNFIIGNYNSQEAIDTDDGSCYFIVEHNFFPYSIDNGLKSDYGGHDTVHHNNIYAYVANTCFSINIGQGSPAQLPGHIDQYYNNTCVINRDNNKHWDYGRFDCAAPQNQWPILGNNIVYTLDTNAINNTGLCGESEGDFKDKYPGIDVNTKIGVVSPSVDAVLIAQARAMLFT